MESIIADKIQNNERISDEDALWLLLHGDLMFLGEMASIRRKNKVGNKAFYQYNFNINHTTICENKCNLCAFYDNENGYTLSVERIQNMVAQAYKQGVNEVHIVGGLNRDLPLSYFIDMCRAIKDIDQKIHIQAFTPVEIDFFARISGKSIPDVLSDLKEAGLGSLPGGGAEIFSPRVRSLICPDKISGTKWLEIMADAHSMGILSNATMLYGTVEKPEEIIDHMSRLRALQDQTKGFCAFVPLAFFARNTKIQTSSISKETSGVYDMRIISLGRIYLDNFDHVKCLWMIYGYKGCQVGLDFGADDIGGTYFDEIIVHSAGAKTPKSATQEEICSLMRNMGREPVEVTSTYELTTPVEVLI
ncbi:MAG: CofH family radical SAM protein [Candidatus Auribacter fodinae]|jgi:aminodeoxyfutalosine synthase|uniref:CofH family radical SAM protein n=1 Tax=Candidatus Auribacter fodinae TaxID=2093366 RepID=A0A3A4RJ60_9BACT|nr:MAG: CofH family radical SAM protein [Candidatus Auribacter fodinae]